MSHDLIRQYYEYFNGRRFTDAAELFADDAILEHLPLGEHQSGGAGYIRFAEMWVQAFPDCVVTVAGIDQCSDAICEVDLVGSGTHLGVFDLGPYGVFKPSGAQATLRFRELLEVRTGKITYSSVTFDVHDLIRQLTPGRRHC